MLLRLWHKDDAQDIAEYALMLAVLLVIVITVIQAIGNGANTMFSKVASTMAAVN